MFANSKISAISSCFTSSLQSIVVNVQLDELDIEYHDTRKSVLLETHVFKNQATGLQVEDRLLQPSFEGKAQVVCQEPSRTL